MKTCPLCQRVCDDNFDTCPDDQVPLSLSPDAARFHFNPIDSYYGGGAGGIDWMESTLRSLEEVLAVTPSHEGAAALKAEVNRALPAFAARADEFFLAAEARLAEGDLVGCLEILAGPEILRRKQALELRNRVRSRIADGARADPLDERAKRLANELLRGLDVVYFEGLGTLAELEYLSKGLEDVLFLTPADAQSARWKKSLDESIRKLREAADKSFRKGQGDDRNR